MRTGVAVLLAGAAYDERWPSNHLCEDSHDDPSKHNQSLVIDTKIRSCVDISGEIPLFQTLDDSKKNNEGRSRTGVYRNVKYPSRARNRKRERRRILLL